MAQIFHRSFNTIAKVSVFGGLLILAGVALFFYEYHKSPFVTQVDVSIEQEVPFSHKHHVMGLGIDCRYCHTSVEESPFAGIPPTQTCMNCHSQIWTDAPILEPVRQSYKQNKPLEWIRVHDVPDYVYFNHSIHVAKGISCKTCHGEVDKMPLMRKENTLHMSWCLNCHRHPEKYVGPKDEVFNMHYEKPSDQQSLGKKLVKEHDIVTAGELTNCSVCHR